MNRAVMVRSTAASLMIFAAAGLLLAADWPQWRGLNRTAKVTDFKAPSTWPSQLTQKWKVTVGEGAASPALVGDKLYVFSRENGQEIIRCLDAATGNELWQDKYESEGADGGARRHSGPRASPTVAEGKVVTFGVRGVLSCLDAHTGKVLWRKDDFQAWPAFFTASSPIVVDGLCIAELGGQENGAIVAYDLDRGEEKWKWTGASPSHASPVLMNVDGSQLVVALVAGKMLALNASNGEVAWQTEVGGGGFGGPGRGGFGPGRGFGPGGGRRGPEGQPRAGEDRERTGDAAQQEPGRRGGERGPGRGGPGGPGGPGFGRRGGGGGMRDRFAATPVVDGQTIIYVAAGGNIKATRLEKSDGKINAKDLWTNGENSLGFSTPIVKDGLVFGLTGNSLFFCINAETGKTAWTGPRDTGGGYGSIVDAGSVLLAITPRSELIVIKPTDKEYTELARIKLSDSETYSHLVVAGNRLFVKDHDSLALFTVD